MGEIIMSNWDLREFRVWVNLPSLIRQLWVRIRHIIRPIQALSNRIRHVVPLISHIRLYPPYCSRLDPPFVGFSSTALPSPREHKVTPSLSISRCHNHELTPSCSIPSIQHTPSTAYTQDCPSFLHSHHYKLTPECCFSFWHSYLQIDRYQPVLYNIRAWKVK